MKQLFIALLLLVVPTQTHTNTNPIEEGRPPVGEITQIATLPEPQIPPVQKLEPVISNDCQAAMRRHWPAALWDEATITMTRESGQRSTAEGAVNFDGSRDYGCFQINNKAHAAFFAAHDWRDANANAAYGYQVYKDAGSWRPWFAVRGVLWN